MVVGFIITWILDFGSWIILGILGPLFIVLKNEIINSTMWKIIKKYHSNNCFSYHFLLNKYQKENLHHHACTPKKKKNHAIPATQMTFPPFIRVGWRMRLWQNPLSACVDQLKKKKKISYWLYNKFSNYHFHKAWNKITLFSLTRWNEISSQSVIHAVEVLVHPQKPCILIRWI